MKTKHTKGEWKVSEIYTNKICVESPTETAIIAEFGLFGTLQKPKNMQDIETISNAKLIAAAPELLEMLNEMTKMFGGARGFVATSEEKSTVIIKSLTAIKKATN